MSFAFTLSGFLVQLCLGFSRNTLLTAIKVENARARCLKEFVSAYGYIACDPWQKVSLLFGKAKYRETIYLLIQTMNRLGDISARLCKHSRNIAVVKSLSRDVSAKRDNSANRYMGLYINRPLHPGRPQPFPITSSASNRFSASVLTLPDIFACQAVICDVAQRPNHV